MRTRQACWLTTPGPRRSATVKNDVNFIAPSLDGRARPSGWMHLMTAGRWNRTCSSCAQACATTRSGYQGDGYNQMNTDYLSFSADGTAMLKPGSVLVPRYDKTSGEWGDAVITREEFGPARARTPAGCTRRERWGRSVAVTEMKCEGDS